MLKGMDLGGNTERSKLDATDAVGIAFAVRALAVIRVHDSEAAKARGLTLRQICDAEEYLRGHAETLSAYLFRAFGRNCLPVLQSFLSGVKEEAALETEVLSHVHALERNLGL